MSEHIIEIPDYTSPFDPVARAVSLGEEIVRCRDCERYHDNIQACDLFAVNEWDSLTYASVEPNGFCAWGERRDA